MSDYFKKRMEELGLKNTTPTTNSSDKSTITQDKNKGSGYFEQRAEELELNKDKTDDYGIKKWFTDTESTLKEMSSYYETSADKFTTDFGGTTSKRVKELLDSSKDVYDYLHNHKGEISNFEDMEKALSEYRSALMQFDYSNNKYQQYYSQFGSEEEFNEASKINELYNMSSEEISPYVNAYSEDIANLDAQRNALKKKITNYNRGDRSVFRTYEDKKEADEQLKKYEKQIDALQQKSKEGSIAYTTMGGQNITWQSLYDDAKDREEFEALYSSVSGSADFERAVQSGMTYQNPDIRTAEKGKVPVNKVKYVEDNYAYIGAGELNGGGSNIVHTRIALMEDKEKEIYNYYFGRGEFDKAEEYLKSLDSKLTERFKNQEIESWKKLANDMPVATSIISVFTSMASGAEHIKNSIDYFFSKDGEMERNHLSDITSTIRGTVSEKVNWEIGNWDAFDFVYNSGMSMADSFASTMMLGNLGGLALGLSAAGQGTNAALDRGMTGDDAFWTGFTSGLFEGLFETASIGKFNALKEIPGNTVKAFARNLGSSMITNASEEALTEIANIAYDLVANGAFSQAETAVRMYMAAGMSEKDARNKVLKENIGQVIEAGASGAFMGIGMGGVGQGVGYYNNTKATGQSIIENKGYDDLKALAVSMSEEASGINSVDKAVTKADKKTTAWNVGRLSQAVDSVRGQQNVADVKTALVDGGMDERQAQNTAEKLITIAEKNASGADLTKAEYKFITKDSATYNAYTSLLSNPDSAVHSRNTQHSNARNGIIKGEDGSETLSEGAESRVTERVAQMVALDNIASESRYKANTGTVEKDADGVELMTAEEAAEHKGKTTYINPETGEVKTVGVRGISSIKDGEMMLKLDNGETVNAEDVRFSSDGEAMVYSTVLDMGVDAGVGEALVNEFKASGADAGTYALGIKDAYRLGRMGIDLSHLPQSSFARQLSKEQQSYVHKLGATSAEAEVAAKQKANDEIVKSGKKAKGVRRAGEVIAEDGVAVTSRGEIIEDGLNDLQKKSLLGIKALAKVSPINFHVFQSEKVDGKFVAKINGQVVESAPNGVYFSGTNDIWIDLNSGDMGEGTMLWTASHEISHYIRERSPAKWKAMADYLMQELAKNKDVSITELLDRQKAKIMAREDASTKTEAEIEDEAYEELVSDALSDMLTDGTVVEFLANLKQKDKGVWESIKKAIADILKRWGEVLGVYKDRTPDTAEAQALAGMEKAYKKLQKLYAEAFAEANEVEVARQLLQKNGIDVVTDGGQEAASLNSVRNLLDSDQRQKVAKALADRFDVTEEEAMDWLKAESSLASLILNPKYSKYLDYEADPDEDAIKKNSDYPQGTVDFSNICKKRRAFTEVMNRILRNFPNHVFMATDLAKIRTIMSEEDMEVACAICYVEDRRQLDSIVGQNFLDSLELYRNGSKTRPDGKAFNAQQLKAFKLIEGDSYTPSIYELVTLEGRNELKAKNPNMEAAWVTFNNARGMQSVRLLTNEAEYDRQILKYNKNTVKSKNDLGGLRIYSFSDMEMFHLIDIIQVITDSSAVGLMIQGYTKVNEYAKAVRNTGEKLNRSLIPLGDLGYHIEDGKVVLDFDTVEGIDINHPDFFDSTDNPDVGNIVIGINETQIRAAMGSEFIDYIIPFHTGQSKEVLGEKGIAEWNNYEDSQSERDLSTNKKSAHQINIYTEVIQAAEKEGKPIKNKVDFVNKFLAVCKENGLKPRFSEFLNTNESGDYVYTEGYHKFLVDFKTFDPKTGEYLPQKPVKPVFDDGYITGLLKSYAESQAQKDAEFAEAMPRVIDRITNEVVKPAKKLSARNTQQDSDIRYSERNKAPVFYSHMGKVVDGIKTEKVGAAGVVPYLKGKGVKNDEIKWSGIEAWLEGKKSVTKAELQEFIAGSMLQIGEQMFDSGAAIDIREAKDTDYYAYALFDEAGNEIDRYYYDYAGELQSEKTGETYLDIETLERELRKDSDNTRWSQYKLNGGSNYRELVFTMPGSSYTNKAMRNHWGEDAKGILAHARLQDFVVNGQKMLFVEEIQSDWHNGGRGFGYEMTQIEESQRLAELQNKHTETMAELSNVIDAMDRELMEADNAEADGVPFDISKYEELALKHGELRSIIVKTESEIGKIVRHRDRRVPHAPFAENYHEYVMKRLIRMAAEEGYDSIGWTTAQIQSDRWSDEFAEGYRIEYDQDIPKFLNKYGKKWGAKVGTTEIDTDDVYNPRYTKVWSMPIPDAMKDSVLYESQALYSERNTDSNRSLLASALETTAQNEAEANKLKEYKAKIDLIDAEQKKLAEINAEIRELSFSAGKRDAKRLKALRFDAAQAANRINTYDRQLLNLESTKVLKAVLDREKGLARKKQKKENAAVIADYRAKYEAKMREQRQLNAASRRKATEGRNKTVMKNKIKGVISELNTLFTRGNKEKNVKMGLRETVATAIASAELLFSDDITNEMIVKHGFSLPLSDKENALAWEYSQALGEIADYEAALEKLNDSEDIGAAEKRRGYLDKRWKLKTKLKDLDKKLADAFERERKQYNSITTETILKELASAYGKLKNADEDYLRAAYDDSLREHISNLAEYLADEPTIRDMSLDSLQKVYKAYKMVLTVVKKANSSFKADKAVSVSSLANNTMAEVEKAGGSKTHVLGGKIGSAISAVKSFDFNNLKPVYFFERIGSKTLSMLFENVRKGEDTWAVDVTEAKEFKEAVAKKYGYDKWDFDKVHTFKSSTGREFTLTLEQMMSLYAYSKREQALPHLAEGGFVFDQSIETYKEKDDGKKSILKYRVNTATAYKITESEVGEVIAELESIPGAKGFVDEMQEYLSSVMGAKGNEVTVEMYGVELFGEKFYFPLKSAKQYMFEQNEVAGEVKIKNSSFSKETRKHANNPIILSNFMDVWANHVNDMSMYHAFVLPLEDFNRVFNYSTPAADGIDSEAVKGFIQNAYGIQANQYISQLLKDLNGGARVDPRESISKKMTSSFKKAKTFASASVVFQQPSAVARALAEINPKYFDFNPKIISHKKHWEELKKYAPVAIIKEMGHFDTDMGMSTVDYIKGDKTIMNRVDNFISAPAAYMDELTWVHIWTAVKREVKANNKALAGEELLKKSGERFTEVITKTQVYDSVLSRSANMRSKSGLMNMITSFMAEPTTSINMIENAVSDWKRGNKGKAAGSVASVAASVVLNSLLVSLVYGARDDDEDETYLEKYLGSLSTELVDGFNLITYYPILKDIWSIAQGYEVKRSDMSLIDDVVSSMKDLITAIADDDTDSKEIITLTHSVAGKLSSIVGLPVDNLIRDVKAIFNIVETGKRGQETNLSLILDKVSEDVKRSLPIVGWLPGETKQDKLYDAIVSGDRVYINRLKSGYKTDAAYINAVSKALRENDSRIREAAVARLSGDMTKYKEIALEIKREGHFSQDEIVRAINSEMNALTKDDSTSELTEKPLYTSADYYKAALSGDAGDVAAVKAFLIGSGKTESQIQSSFNSSVKDAYEQGEIDSMKAVSLMISHGGKTSEEASTAVKYVDFKKRYPNYADSITETKYAKYYAPISDTYEYSLEDVGISVGEYAEYCDKTKGITGTDEDGDGKTDSGSKKAAIMEVIDDLPITSEQKDALYYLNGWSKKTIYEAPWH